MNTAEVKAALRARFCAPEWAIFFEVADGTGGNHNRWADAVAMNMWPSRGLAIHGFEIKVSRSDWLRELKKPEKSGPVQQYCDRWWIVTPKGIVKREELPPTWGLYEVSEAGAFRQVVEAPKLEPIPVTRDFMAAILRRASGIDAEAMAAAVSKEVVRQRAGDHARVTAEIERLSREEDSLRKKVSDFERISGLSITGWGQSEAVANAVKFVLETGIMKSYGGIDALATRAETFARDCRDAAIKFPSEFAKS